jgi:hypothetical protein
VISRLRLAHIVRRAFTNRSAIRNLISLGLGVALFVFIGSLSVSPSRGIYTRARAYAATPSTLNFQARLLNNGGSIVADGTYSVDFNLYNVSSGGTTQWTETQSVQVKAGYLSVYLGKVTPFPGTIDWGQEQWLTMNVNGDGEMSPRLKLTAVPYAFRSGQADRLTDGSSSLTSSDLLQKAPLSIQSLNAAVAGLRLNQTGSGGLLQLQGGGSDVFTVSKTGVGWLAGLLDIDGSSVDVGTSSLAGNLILNDGSSNTGTLQTLALGSNRTYQLPDADGVVCLTTTCPGAANGFVQNGNSFSGLATLGTNDNFALGFETFGTTKMTILPGGNVGIGEANPGALFSVGSGSPFQVNNSGNVTGVGLNNGSGGITNAGSITGVGTNLTASAGLTIATTGSNNLVLNSGSGLVTLGATTLQTSDNLGLDLNKATNDTFTIQNSGAGVASLNVSDGDLQTNGVVRLTNAGVLQNVTGLTVSSGGATIGGDADINGLAAIGDNASITNTTALNINEIFDSAINCSGGCYGLSSVATINNPTSPTRGVGARGRVDTAAAAFTLTDAYALFGQNASKGVGSTITNNYGLFIEDMTAGTNDYGIAIAGADSAVLWLSSAADNTDAANGITFGLSKDTTLYRSAASTLRTAGAFSTGAGVTVDTSDINAVAGSIATAGTVRLTNGGGLQNITGFSQSSGNFGQSGTGTFGTGSGLVSLNGATTVSTSTASTAALTVNGTSGTAATALNVVQTGDAANFTLSNNARTTGALISLTQSTSTFTGTGLLFNFASGSGSFASGNFLDFQLNGTTKVKIANTGAFQVNSDSTAALQVRNSAGTTSFFNIDTSGNIIQVGSATGDATAIQFVLDGKTGATDPASGTNGAMYYNSTNDKFRCYEGAAWGDCITGGGSATLVSGLETSATATNLAATTLNCVSDPSLRTTLNWSNAKKLRWQGRIGNALAAATKVRLQYHTGGNIAIATGDAGWTTLDTSAGSHTVNTYFYTSEVAIPSAAQINGIIVRACLFDGNGTADPTITGIVLNAYR